MCKERETPLRPATLYGKSKNQLHDMLKSKGIDYAWGRIFFLYGPNEPKVRLVPAVIIGLLSKKEVACTSGEQIRDFLYSADIAEAFAAWLQSDVYGPVNIESGNRIRLKDLIENIGRLTGHGELVRLGALPRREEDPAILVPDVSRLQDEVSWKPSVSLEEGLRTSIG